MDYKAQYVRSTKVKELLVDEKTGTKIRISGEALGNFYKYLDDAVKKACQDLINKLPRKSKGQNKGQLSRITIKVDDFN